MACNRPSVDPEPQPAVPTEEPEATTRETPEATEEGWTDIAIPDTPVGARALTFIALLRDRTSPPTVADFDDTFTEAFIAQVPLEQVAGIAAYLGGLVEGFRVERIEDGVTPHRISIVLQAPDDSRYRLQMEVEEAAPHLVHGLLLLHAPDLAPEALGDLQDLVDNLRAWEEESTESRSAHLLIARLEDDGCAPVISHQSDLSLAIGSTFKLWVLGATAEAVEAEALRWDQEVPLRNTLLSIGQTEFSPGTAPNATLRALAEAMIRASDNTATDHVMEAAGRRAVERWMRGAGHSHPHRNVPMPSTSELTAMKLQADGTLRAQWLEGDASSRRALLDDLAPRDLSEHFAHAEAWTTPRDIDTLEWFANADDLCKTMLALRNLSERGPATRPILEILGLNPGLEFDRRRWPYIGFKGGSEPGVLSMTWLMLDSVGEWYVFVLGANDTASNLPMGRFFAQAQAFSQHFGATPSTPEP